MVREVTSGDIAYGQLLAGDWIRSINGNAIIDCKQPHQYLSAIRNNKELSLRVVVQRPASISRKGAPRLNQVAQSINVRLAIPPPSADSYPSTPSPSSSLPFGRQGSPLPVCVTNASSPMPFFAGASSGGFRRTVSRTVNTFPALDSASVSPHGLNPGEHIPLTQLSPTTTQPTVAACEARTDVCVVSWARVVVCGAHGSPSDFVRAWTGDVSGVKVDCTEKSVQTFHLALSCNRDRPRGGSTAVRSVLEPLATLVQKQLKQQQEVVHSDKENLVNGVSGDGPGEKTVKTEWRESAQLLCGDTVNVELYVINDEEFFHHCAAWLLPSATVVVLTFHDHKLLNQPESEMQRLEGMVHTVRSSVCSSFNASNESTNSSNNHTSSNPLVPSGPEILLYGVPSGSQHDHSAEEIQAIFYVTPCGPKLLEQAVVLPNTVLPSSTDSVDVCRRTLHRRCMESACRQPVRQATVSAMDALYGFSAGCVALSAREVSAVVNGVRSGNEGARPVSSREVVEDLLRIGLLIDCGKLLFFLV